MVADRPPNATPQYSIHRYDTQWLKVIGYMPAVESAARSVQAASQGNVNLSAVLHSRCDRSVLPRELSFARVT